MLNYEPRIYKKNFRSGDLIYGARDYRNEINTIQDKLPYTINIYNDYVFGMFGLSAPLFNTPDKIYNLTITSEMMNVIENPTNQQNIENLKKAISAPYTKSFFNYSGFYIPYSFLDIYLKLLIGDIASKFSVENIAKRFTGMQLLDRQALFLKRLCKLGMEWALINNKHIHFLVPNFFDTKSWDNLFNEKRNKKNQLSLHITTVEIMHLLKHFERYREIVYFYDQITGNELPVSRVEQLFLSKIKNAEKREKLNKIYEDNKSLFAHTKNSIDKYIAQFSGEKTLTQSELKLRELNYETMITLKNNLAKKLIESQGHLEYWDELRIKRIEQSIESIKNILHQNLELAMGLEPATC